MIEINVEQKKKNFQDLTDREAEITEKIPNPVGHFITKVIQPVVEHLGENMKHYASLDFETFQYEIGMLMIEEFTESKIERLSKYRLELSDAVNYGLIGFKRAYENYHKESYGEIMEYETIKNKAKESCDLKKNVDPNDFRYDETKDLLHHKLYHAVMMMNNFSKEFEKQISFISGYSIKIIQADLAVDLKTDKDYHIFMNYSFKQGKDVVLPLGHIEYDPFVRNSALIKMEPEIRPLFAEYVEAVHRCAS